MLRFTPVCIVQEFCYCQPLQNMIKPMMKKLELLDFALCEYLDKKRTQFGRLYFTSNEELIELLGN